MRVKGLCVCVCVCLQGGSAASAADPGVPWGCYAPLKADGDTTQETRASGKKET